MTTHSKVSLAGFNNLSRNLSLNLYEAWCLDPAKHGEAYLRHVDERYQARRLGSILHTVAAIIGARVLHVSTADYEPRGASVTMLVAEAETEAAGNAWRAETPEPPETREQQALAGPGAGVAAQPAHTLLYHLDKSHLAVHTYPEPEPLPNVSILRTDIDLSSCGAIPPLKVLNYLLRSFQPDVATMDYRVRGFTRDALGGKCFNDHPVASIQDFIAADVASRYRCRDADTPAGNTLHTRMMLRDPGLREHLFGEEVDALDSAQRRRLQACLQRELQDLYQQD